MLSEYRRIMDSRERGVSRVPTSCPADELKQVADARPSPAQSQPASGRSSAATSTPSSERRFGFDLPRVVGAAGPQRDDTRRPGRGTHAARRARTTEDRGARDRRRRRGETTYLEVKSSLDFGGKTGVAKVARFLLGAANRRPNEAAEHFHGYAVLVIGAQKGGAPGVPRGAEPHELEDRLRPYLGPQFPAFEFGRIGVDATNEVLFVIAQPPQEGQPIFPCQKSFQGDDRRDSLEDGAIYVRGTSNTRPARAGEVLALVEKSPRRQQYPR